MVCNFFRRWNLKFNLLSFRDVRSSNELGKFSDFHSDDIAQVGLDMYCLLMPYYRFDSIHCTAALLSLLLKMELAVYSM